MTNLVYPKFSTLVRTCSKQLQRMCGSTLDAASMGFNHCHPHPAMKGQAQNLDVQICCTQNYVYVKNHVKNHGFENLLVSWSWDKP